MRITCEKCQAVYCISERVIGATGRIVKCAKCAYTWMVTAPSRSFASYKASSSNLQNFNYKINLPVLFKPALPYYIKVIPFILVLLIAFAGLIFFSEKLINIKPTKIIYEKCGVHSTKGLLLSDFTVDTHEKEISVNGFITNSSDEDKVMPDIRYILLNNNKEVIFRYTKASSKKIIKANQTIPISAKISNLKGKAEYLQLDIGNKLELLLR